MYNTRVNKRYLNTCCAYTMKNEKHTPTTKFKLCHSNAKHEINLENIWSFKLSFS